MISRADRTGASLVATRALELQCFIEASLVFEIAHDIAEPEYEITCNSSRVRTHLAPEPDAVRGYRLRVCVDLSKRANPYVGELTRPDLKFTGRRLYEGHHGRTVQRGSRRQIR